MNGGTDPYPPKRLSRHPPAPAEVPPGATDRDFARAYAAVFAFIHEQWPVLVDTLERIERKNRVHWLWPFTVGALFAACGGLSFALLSR